MKLPFFGGGGRGKLKNALLIKREGLVNAKECSRGRGGVKNSQRQNHIINGRLLEECIFFHFYDGVQLKKHCNISSFNSIIDFTTIPSVWIFSRLQAFRQWFHHSLSKKSSRVETRKAYKRKISNHIFYTPKFYGFSCWCIILLVKW